MKKALYLFLSAILGCLLFLILQRIVVFFYLYMIAGNYISPNFNYVDFVIIDYTTLVLAMLLGGWYGTWVGLYWFGQIYEHGAQQGFVSHFADNYLFPPRQPLTPMGKVAEVKQQIQNSLSMAEEFVAEIPQPPIVLAPEPIKRKIVRKRAPKKPRVGPKLKVST